MKSKKKKLSVYVLLDQSLKPTIVRTQSLSILVFRIRAKLVYTNATTTRKSAHSSNLVSFRKDENFSLNIAYL